jgi:hypothetical protein
VTRIAKGPGPPQPRALKISRHQATDQQDKANTTDAVKQVPEVRGFAAPPVGRRRMWAVVVPVCCWCRGLHIHRAAGARGGLRVGSCGRAYLVRLVGAKRWRWTR